MLSPADLPVSPHHSFTHQMCIGHTVCWVLGHSCEEEPTLSTVLGRRWQDTGKGTGWAREERTKAPPLLLFYFFPGPEAQAFPTTLLSTLSPEGVRFCARAAGGQADRCRMDPLGPGWAASDSHPGEMTPRQAAGGWGEVTQRKVMGGADAKDAMLDCLSVFTCPRACV